LSCQTPSEANHNGVASVSSLPDETRFPTLVMSSVPFDRWSWRYQSLGSPPAARARRLASSLRPGRCALGEFVGVDESLDVTDVACSVWLYQLSDSRLLTLMTLGDGSPAALVASRDVSRPGLDCNSSSNVNNSYQLTRCTSPT